MPRHVQLTTTITLNVAEDVSEEEFRRGITEQLRLGFRTSLSEHDAPIHIVAINDSHGELHQDAYLLPLMAAFGQTAIVWSYRDVLEVRPDLTVEQASCVVHEALHYNTTSPDVGWDTLEYTAERLFGAPSEKTV
ncbi:hypothetical protein [Fuerstiella marisgermanici]|uniref:Uncharacterized protein n=1 Tax=Fuerstiella marisgermanici TaxID=1891926 RepID=A0A1P8WKD1_9PLAN|nr:hypothetical protein [Fuerstiella marisgermanici]APZ94512.1 hypothetical protein Fuma_04144 [Fuerstiella marisgermanici]